MKRYPVAALLCLVVVILTFRVAAQSVPCPANIDFELGNFTNWQLSTGTCCAINTPTLGIVAGRHTITSGTATDPYGGFPIVSPGGLYSLKLGNNSTGAQAERAKYYVHVPAGVNNYSLIFRYAVVFQDPSHTAAQQPRFEVKAYDSITNAIVNCSQFTYVATSNLPGFTLSGLGGGIVWYKGWTTASINMSGYAGRTVVVDFASGDCSLGGHFGYGYIDLDCGLFKINTTACNSNPFTTLSAPPGFQSYIWKDSTLTTTVGTGQNVSIATPSATTKYAVILIPYTGYGCPDTLYTTVTVSNMNLNAKDTSICIGSSAMLTSNATGTGTPYTYTWSPSTALSCTNCANPITNTTVNRTYYVSVTNTDGCTRLDTLNVRVSNISLALSKQHVSCYGMTNGSITATPSGGISPYTYSWNSSPVQTTATATGLNARGYTIAVTDSIGCIKTALDTITQPTLLTITKGTITHVSCFGGNNGTATIVASGGAPPYNYNWSNAANTNAVTALAAGMYTVTITDSKGCSATDTVIITQPPLLTTATTTTHVFCNGGNNGTATTVTSGGTIPYSYSWNTTPVKTTAAASTLSAGTYIVSVTDNKGCVAKDTITITQPTPLTATHAQTNVICNGSNTGSTAVTVSGGTIPYSYSWNTSPVQITSAISTLNAGTYVATITDNKGCTTKDTTIITQPSHLNSTVSKTDLSCFGGNNGTATVNVTGGTPPYLYAWGNNPPSTTNTASGLTIGIHTVIITDNNGCSKTDTAIITQPPLLTTSKSKTDVSCFGGNNATATIITTGGTPPYTYNWSNAANTNAVTALAAGMYTVTVTDSKGCSATDTVIITQPPLLTTVTTTTHVFCNGGNNGTATTVTSGGTIPYSYSWNTNPVKTTAAISALTAGTYIVTVTDNKGCLAKDTITITQPTPLTTTHTQTNVLCNGSNTGSTALTVAGGTTPYTYSWNTSPIQTTQAISALSIGTYIATITDNKGCTIRDTTIITQPLHLNATVSKTDVSCFNANNGTATVVVQGGVTPYTYSWSTNPTQILQTATGLSAGQYIVTILDSNNCSISDTINIQQPTPLIASLSKTDVNCFNGNNATATINVSGGTTPYTYSWNTVPQKTTPTATTLKAGVYSVLTTDNKGCTRLDSIQITEPTQLTTNISHTNVSCLGGNNGTATVVTSGGTLPYTYLWNTTPQQTNAFAINLSAGSKIVLTTDGNGCTKADTVVITQSSQITSTITSTNVSCFGGNNGTATVTVAGGSPPYSYIWNTNPVRTTNTASGLTMGIYTVTITDSKGCAKMDTASITQPPLLNISKSKTDVSCFGGNNATATIIATGGTPPYTYNWSNFANTDNIAGLSAGIYTVTVTDNKGCSATDSILIIQPTLLTTATNTTNVFCNAGDNGTATTVASGGTIPYSYSWNTNPVKTTAAISALTAGTYIVTVTDNKGCVARDTVIITQPTPLTATHTQTNVLCNGSNNGSTVLTVAGGTTPYTYSWNTSPAQTSPAISGLNVGTYIAAITDGKGCTVKDTTIITQPSHLNSTISKTDVHCFNGNNGTATVVVNGGVSPYTYSWSTSPKQTLQTATGLSAGQYTVTVLDSNNCSISDTVNIQQPTPLIATLTKTDVNCFNGNNGTATINVSGGTAPYTYSWYTIPAQTTPIATLLKAGVYSVLTTDNNGCTRLDSIQISEPTPLTTNTSHTSVNCFGGNNGTATVIANGGTQPYTYVWNTTPQQTNAYVTNLSAGSKIVFVTDAHGCTKADTVIITHPSQITSSIVSTNVNCFGGNNGTATVTIAGGTPPYSYTWNTNPPRTTNTASALIAGIYTITVTDSKGCIKTDTATIAQPSLLTTSKSKTDVNCFGNNNGTATIVASGGTIPYSYLWSTSPAQTTPTAIGLTANTYIARTTDANGCIIFDTLIVTQPTPLTNTKSKIDVSCFGGNNGTATIIASGATPPYYYSWNTSPIQTTQTANILTAGNYIVVITDSKGCSKNDTITINQPQVLIASVNTTDLKCYNDSTGSIIASATGGTTPYSYSWNTIPKQTTASINQLHTGTYTVTITDSKGCIDTKNAIINQPTMLSSSINMQDVKCFGGKDGSATILVTGGTKPYSYSWNNYTTAATNTKLSIGKYTVYVSDAHGCWLTDSVTISEPTLLEVEASEKAKTCFGFSNGSASAIVKGGLPPYSYLWNTVPQQTGTNAQNLLGGLYIVTVIDSNGCTQDDTVDVGNFPNPKVVVNDVNAICFGKQTELNASGTHTYKWSPSQTLLCDSCSTTIAYPKSTTEYRVIGTDINGCADTTFVTVNVIPKKEVSVGADLNICFGEEATLSANGGERYQWYPNIPLSNQYSSNPIVKPDTTITYTVVITENECFTDTLKQTVTVHPQPTINLGPDLKGTPGSTIQLKADMSFADKIKWTPETGLSCYDCLNPLAYLSRTITYIATAYSDYCKAMDDITIRVACDDALFFIPNTFTPNGDGANDRFYPSASGVSKIDIFRVYNRWGEKIFEARDFAPNKEEYGWDGKDKNQPLTPDVYVYYLESRCANGEKIFLKGDISLIR